MFYQIFLSPQVKRWTIITYKDGIYESPHKLANKLRLRIFSPTAFSPLGGPRCPHKKKKKTQDLRKLGSVRELSKPHRMIAQCPVPPSPSPKPKLCQYQQKTLQKQKLNSSYCALFHMKTRVSLKNYVRYCLWKLFFDSKSPQTPSNLISLTFLVTLRPFTLF